MESDASKPAGRRKVPAHPTQEVLDSAVALHARLVADAGAGAAWVRERLEREGWAFASSMADNPHYYTLRDRWTGGDEDPWVEFYACCLFIRTQGTVRWWPSVVDGFPYVGLSLGGFYYWTMGYPLGGHRSGPTYLINRKVEDPEADPCSE